MAIGPTTLNPSECLPCIWGNEEKTPSTLSKSKTLDMMGLIFQRYNGILFDLEQAAPSINPLYNVVKYRNKEYNDPAL